MGSTIEKLERYWTSLSDSRVSAARQQIEQLTDETTGRELGASDVMELLRARLSLLEQELPILQKTALLEYATCVLVQPVACIAGATDIGLLGCQ